jgi:PAS domain S-box-containing protein
VRLPVTLQSSLTALTLAALLPVALFAAVVALLLVLQDRETLRRGAEARTLAMITAIDTALAGDIATLGSLATSQWLDNDDLARFRDRAERVIATRSDWSTINLALPSGQQVMNLRRAPGSGLPDIAAYDSGWQAAVARETPFVSDLVTGPVTGAWDYAVRVPVIRGDSVKYVLSAVVTPEAISRLLQRQDLPPQWVGVVLDRSDRIVARTVEPEKSAGKLASESLRNALARSPSGWFRGSTIEGAAVYTPYRRSEISGWAFAMGIPAQAVDAAAWRAAGLLGFGLLAALLLAFALARLVGRRISAPIALLATATDAIGRGEGVRVPQTSPIAEIGRLAHTLQECIDAIREREERMRMALDAGRMGSWEWNVKTSEVKWSPELEAIHGIAPGGFGGTFAAFEKDVHPEDLDKVRNAAAASVQPGCSEHQVEYRIVRPDGAVRWVEGRGKVFFDEGGKPARLVGVCADVTDRKRVEQALREADYAKDEFLAMLSHELRNPLAALTTAAHVLRISRPGSAAAAHAGEVVERQTSHMVRLVEDLLDISRVTMGKLALQREVLDLAALVCAVVHGWRSAGRLDRHRVVAEGRAAWVHADRDRVEQVIANLLDNAVKFTPEGGAVSLRVSQEGGEVALRVSDTGRGIPAQALGRVFEPFVQGEHGIDRAAGGLGLGLALVKRLVEVHGGTVAAESAGEQSGACFTVRLPAVAAPSEQPAAAPRTPLVSGRRTVLVIEDNADAREMLRTALVLSGHEVRTAADGAAALAAATQMRPDVALIDIGLPDIDGYEVARRLRTMVNGTRIGLIAVSGYGQAEDQRRALDAGFDAHLTKPVAPERLQAIITGLP